MILDSQCWIRNCKHLIGVKQDNEDESTERWVCAAFPDRIPREIAFGNNKHTKKHPLQKNDIVYEKEE